MIYEIFPFLQSFPFKEYIISSVKDSDKFDDILNKEELVDFQYTAFDKDIAVSFYREDIEFLNMISDNIKLLDSLREDIDKGLDSSDILVKFESIKHSKKFLKKIKSPAEKGDVFKSVFEGLQEINEVKLSDGIVGKINKLDKRLAKYQFTVNESMAVEAYLNFQLHHVKIMLGIVIASKIH
jgi:hypothetical protein